MEWKAEMTMVIQQTKRQKAATLNLVSVAAGFALMRVCSGERCSWILVHERGTMRKKF